MVMAVSAQKPTTALHCPITHVKTLSFALKIFHAPTRWRLFPCPSASTLSQLDDIPLNPEYT